MLSAAAGVPGRAENSLRMSKGRHRPHSHLHDEMDLGYRRLWVPDYPCCFLMLSLSWHVTLGKQLTLLITPVSPSAQRHRSHEDGVEYPGLMHGVLFTMVPVPGSGSGVCPLG